MEQKKTEKANLEKKRTTFFEIGLVVVLGLTLIAFEWSSKSDMTNTLGEITEIVEDEDIIPITRQQPEQPPPPPPPPQVIETISIVDDDVELDDE